MTEKLNTKEAVEKHPGYDMARHLLENMQKGGVQIEGLAKPELILVADNENVGAFLDFAFHFQKSHGEIKTIKQASDENGVHLSFVALTEGVTKPMEVEKIYEEAPEFQALLWFEKQHQATIDDREDETVATAAEGLRAGGEIVAGAEAKKRRSDHAETVADKVREVEEPAELTEKQSDYLESLETIVGDIAEALKQLDKIKKATKEQKEAYVYGVRAKIVEGREILKLLAEGMDFGAVLPLKIDGKNISISDLGRYLGDLEDQISTITVDDEKRKQSISVLADLEARRDTISVKEFKNLPIEQRLLMISNLRSWDELSGKKLVTFNFGANEKLEYQVGLGDLMPPKIRQISWNGMSYSRRANQGFYNNGQYLAIFTGTEVKIEKEDLNYDVAKVYTSRFGISSLEQSGISGAKVDQKLDKSSEKASSFTRDLYNEEVLKVAQNFLVDADFLLSVISYIKGDKYYNVEDDYEFLHMAARYIQNAEAKYEQKNGPGSSLEPASGENRYKVDFVVYALDHFNLHSEFQEQRENVLMAIVRQYGTNKGVSLDVDQPMKDKRKTRNTKARAAIASHNRDTKYTRHKPPTREAELDPTIFDFQPIDFSRQKRHDFPPRIHSSQREVTMGTWKGAMTKWRKLTGVTPARMDRGNYTPPNLRKWIVPKLNLFGGVARRPNIIMAVALKEIEYRCKRIEGLENLKFKHISTTNNKPGYHGMGMAVDFDAPDNWMVHYSKNSWNLPLAFVREMEKMGFFWGMYFYENPKGHRKVDPMHFDFRGDLDSLMDSLTSPEAMAMAKEYEIPGTGKSIWEYSGKSGSGGVPEEVAMEKGYENSGTLIRREAEKFEAAGRFVIEKLPGNGGREVAMFIPNGVDPKKAKVTIHFHGTGSQNLGLEVSKERFASTVRAASAGNSILVYPLSAGYRFDRNNKGSAARRDYDDAWMSPGTTDDVQGLYEQALGVVRKQEPDLRVSEVVVQGHSAGGEALKNMAGEFDPGKDVKYTMRFLEASYGDWAQTAHDRLRRIHSDAKLVVCAIAGSKTDKKSRSLRAKLAEDENLEFEDVKTDHGGVIEEFPA